MGRLLLLEYRASSNSDSSLFSWIRNTACNVLKTSRQHSQAFVEYKICQALYVYSHSSYLDEEIYRGKDIDQAYVVAESDVRCMAAYLGDLRTVQKLDDTAVETDLKAVTALDDLQLFNKYQGRLEGPLLGDALMMASVSGHADICEHLLGLEWPRHIKVPRSSSRGIEHRRFDPRRLQHFATRKHYVSYPYSVALRNGDFDVVQKLSEYTSARDSDYYFAGLGGYVDMVEFLLSKFDKDSKSSASSAALRGAAACGHKDLVSSLLARGVPINGNTSKGGSTMGVACVCDRPEIMNVLLEHGYKASCSFVDYSVVGTTVSKGHQRIIKILLENNLIDPKQVFERFDGYQNPLIVAAQHNHVGILRLLLDKWPEISRAEAGYKALYAAVCYGADDAARILLEFGVRDDTSGSRTEWPLPFCARYHGHETILQLLADYGIQDARPTEIEAVDHSRPRVLDWRGPQTPTLLFK